MGARRRVRSSILVDGREFLWNFDNASSGLHIVSADKKLVIRYHWGWPAGGEPATLTVLGPEFAGLLPTPRPVRLRLPTFDHCYSCKGHVRRAIEWSLWADHPIVLVDPAPVGS